MAKFVVNASVDEFQIGEVVEINPSLFADLIDGGFLCPIDDYGNRLSPDGDMLILHSTAEEQRRAAMGTALNAGIVTGIERELPGDRDDDALAELADNYDADE